MRALDALVEGRRDEERQACRRTDDGCFDQAVDRLGVEHDPGLQPSPHAATLVGAAQRVLRFAQASPNAANLPFEAAHREKQATSHIFSLGRREGATPARDVDSQSRGGARSARLSLTVIATLGKSGPPDPILVCEISHRRASMYRQHVDMLNHHHLYHFWMVVREGGVTSASERLHVSQPTVSGQLRELQSMLGEKLLIRSGRSVVLTDVGRTVYRYADEIFALGRELQQAVKGRVSRPARLASTRTWSRRA
jgi:regulatory helix-turn-helix LysR family protein